MSLGGEGKLSAQERLAIRISNMVGAPRAQMERRVTIHRLDSEPDQVWEEVLEILAETEGLDMTLEDDGSLTLMWELADAPDVERVEHEPVAVEAAPF
ncbi:DUF1654 domain-containing protein [Pseudomonas sp. Marseille-QA0892]